MHSGQQTHHRTCIRTNRQEQKSQARAGQNSIEDGRAEQGSAKQSRGADLNEAHDLVKLALADNRPHAAVLSHGVALLDGLCTLLQLLVEGRRYALLHQQA